MPFSSEISFVSVQFQLVVVHMIYVGRTEGAAR